MHPQIALRQSPLEIILSSGVLQLIQCGLKSSKLFN